MHAVMRIESIMQSSPSASISPPLLPPPQQAQTQQSMNKIDANMNMNMNMMNRATHPHAHAHGNVNMNANTNTMTSGMEALIQAQQMHARQAQAQSQQQQMYMFHHHHQQQQQNAYAQAQAQAQGGAYAAMAPPMNMNTLGHQSQYALAQAMAQAQAHHHQQQQQQLAQMYDNSNNGAVGETGYYQQQFLAPVPIYQQPQGLEPKNALAVGPTVVRRQQQQAPMNLLDSSTALKLKEDALLHQRHQHHQQQSQQQAPNANTNTKVQEHPLQYKNRRPGTFSKQMAINSRNSFQALLDLQKKSQGERPTGRSLSPPLVQPPTNAAAPEPSIPIELNGLNSIDGVPLPTTSVPTTGTIVPQLPQYHRYNRTLSSLSTRNPLITRSILNAHSKAIYEAMAAKQAKVKRDKFAAYSGRTASVLGDGPKPVSSRLRTLGKVGAVIFKRRRDPLQFPTRAKADALLKAAVAAVEASDRAKKFAGVESSSDSPHVSSSVHSSDNEIHAKLNPKALDHSTSSGSHTRPRASAEFVNIKPTDIAQIQRSGVSK